MSLVTDRETNHAAPQPAPQQVLEQLQKLLLSPRLRESHQLQTFLEFIVRETIDGRSSGLKEYLLGCGVFGRKPDYDPRHDGIVRVQATLLRKRLEKYYLEEGARDPIIIDLPRGGYVPCFHVREAEPVPEPTPKPAIQAAPPPVKASLREVTTAFILGAIMTALATFVAWRAVRPAAIAPYRVTKATASDF